MNTIVELQIYSPRWGREDKYKIVLDSDFMEISLQMRKTRATWIEGRDPEWSGESLEHTMNNDNIHPPAVTQDLFEYAWMAWRNGKLSDEEVRLELQLVAEWINTVTRSKPNSDFWKIYF